MGAHLAAQGAAGGRPHPRPHRPRGAHRARVHLSCSRARGRESAALGRGECGGEPRADRRHPLRLRGARGRRPDHQALAAARTRPRGPDQEADLPHHDQAFAGRRRHAGAPRPPEPDVEEARTPATESAGALTPEEQKAPRRRGARARGAKGRPEAAEPEAETEVAEPGRSGAGDGGGRRARAEAEENKEKPKRRAPRCAARRRKRRARANGSKGSSGRPARRRHPRLEVELVRRHEGLPRLPARGHQDPRAHLQEAVPRRAVRHPDPQGQAADHGRHLHCAAGHRHRQVGRRGRRAAQRAARAHPQERPHQHQRDQAPRARRQARSAVDRRAAREPRQLPPRDEALARLGDSVRRAGDQDRLRRPARRHAR